MSMHAITGLSLEQQLLIQTKPILVDVWAEWCGPCKKLSPLLERISDGMPEVEFFKVDADANADVLDRYDIRSIPTVLLFNEGKHVGTMVGSSASQAAIELWIKDSLAVD